MKKIVVTGASGFAGSHILQALSDAPVALVAACRNTAKLPPGYKGEVLVGDLREAGYVRQLVEGADTVCHAAAWTCLWKHAQESNELFYQPSLQLLDACVEHGVKRFIYLSTTSAASPARSHDPDSPGIPRRFWPHLCNVVAIENAMRARAGATAMVNLRCGLFAGERYGLGLLPILLPRLKTHLVPWIAGGKTGLPITDGSDIGQAFRLAVLKEGLKGYEGFNIVGPEIPTAREVIHFLKQEFGYPTPHFSVPFPIGYLFAWLMETLDMVVPWEPLVVRSIIHLLEETGADNQKAAERLGYHPRVSWKDAIRKQVREMQRRQKRPMKMAMPAPGRQG